MSKELQNRIEHVQLQVTQLKSEVDGLRQAVDLLTPIVEKGRKDADEDRGLTKRLMVELAELTMKEARHGKPVRRGATGRKEKAQQAPV